jgi:Tol biopolymer transport system component
VVVAKRKLQAVYALCALVTIALLGVSFAYFTQTPSAALEQTTRRFSLSPEGVTAASISPDGRYIAYTVGTPPDSSLWLRAIGGETARQIPGAEGARAVVSGWSPDSQAIVFATTAEVKRVAIGGGDPVKLADLPGAGNQGFRGVTWSPDGERIVFSSTGGALWEIPARGGGPKIVAGATGGGFVEPHFLPADGSSENLVYESSSRIWVANLKTGESSEIGPGSAPVYSRDGYLIHGSADPGDPRLFALPFSLATLKATGEAFPIADGSQSASVAQDGTLVFLDGASTGLYTLVWRNRVGELLETIGQPQPAMSLPALSPGGQRIAVTSNESGNSDIWLHDLARSTKTRLTFDEAPESNPSWSPSGREVSYAFIGDNGYRLLSAAVDGTGEPMVLLESEIPVSLPDWSRDGRYLVYDGASPGASRDIFYLEFGTDGAAAEPVKFLGTPAVEGAPTLSPDGRFVAYYSNESGRFEIYVSPFPSGAGKRQASVNGGLFPFWRSDGRELYYVNGPRLMAVPVSTDQELTFGQPQALFEDVSPGAAGRGAQYDVSADGQRFVTAEPVEGGDENAGAAKIRIVENWSEEFRKRIRSEP